MCGCVGDRAFGGMCGGVGIGCLEDKGWGMGVVGWG